MARMARLVVPHYAHHVTQRGNRRQPVFFGEDDYRSYLAFMRDACTKTETAVLAYCLMPNQVHLLMVPRHEDGLCAAIAEAHRRYTCRVNFREGWRGHLWQERFHSFVMDEAHLAAAVPYVEQNPVRARLCDRPEEWPWSSAPSHLEEISDSLVDRNLLQQLLPGYRTPEPGLPHETCDAVRLHSRTGRPLGDNGFVERLETITGRSLRPARPGPKARER